MSDASPEQPETRHLLEVKIDLLPNAFRTVFVLRMRKAMMVEKAALCLDILPRPHRSSYSWAKDSVLASPLTVVECCNRGG